jgi:hypothetical protein
MFLVKGLKKSWFLLNKKKALFALLFLAQLLFVILFIFVQVRYQVAMAKNFHGIIAPLEQANYDATSIQIGTPFMEGAFKVVENWEALKTNFVYLLVFSFLVLAIFNGLVWSLTHYMIKKQNFLRLWGKSIAMALVFFVPYLLLLTVLFSSSLFESNPILLAQISVAVAIIFVYFGLLSFCFVDFNFKKIFRKVFWEIGLKKFYVVLLLYFLIGFVLYLLGSLLYQSVNSWSIWFVVVFIFAMIFMMNFGRLLLINSLGEIS